MNYPYIKKAERIIGKTLILRDVEVSDVPFIFSIRTDFRKSAHINEISPFFNDQVIYIENYQKKQNEAYFIIENHGESLGTVRLYNPKMTSFSWGSWILRDRIPYHSAIESALMVYSYAIDYLGFSSSHFDVRKENKKVWQFHERFGAIRIAETEKDYFYVIGVESISASRVKYRKYLPEPIRVFF